MTILFKLFIVSIWGAFILGTVLGTVSQYKWRIRGYPTGYKQIRIIALKEGLLDGLRTAIGVYLIEGVFIAIIGLIVWIF